MQKRGHFCIPPWYLAAVPIMHLLKQQSTADWINADAKQTENHLVLICWASVLIVESNKSPRPTG